MCQRLPGQGRNPLPIQPQLLAIHWKASVADHQRWQVRNERLQGRFILTYLSMFSVRITSPRSFPSCQPSSCTSQRLCAVSSGEGKAILVTASGECETFDHIIFACHSGDALRIVDASGGATPEEREILSTFQWVTNEVWLHSDENVGVDSLSCFAPEIAANL
jgi:hypothetical protein